jgi:hypothetical protein
VDRPTPAPLVTAVILPEGGPEAVERLLGDLRRGRCGDPGRLEILLVDGPARGSRQRLARVCARADARVLRGPASAAGRRGAGLRAAMAPVVLFVAADGRVGDGFVEAHHRCWERGHAGLGAVAGPVQFAGSRALEAAAGAGLLVGFRPARVVPGLDWSAGDNLSVHRDLAVRLGGFPEDAAFVEGGDDVELCLRLRQAGCRVEECGAAVLRRQGDWRSVGATVARSWRWGRLSDRLAARHPGLAGRHGPGFVPCSIGLLGLCLLAAVLWRQPGALALWAASALSFVLLGSLPASRDPWSLTGRMAGRALAAVHELARLVEGLRRGDARVLWTRAVPEASTRPGHRASQARDWVVLAAVAGATLLALAGVSR